MSIITRYFTVSLKQLVCACIQTNLYPWGIRKCSTETPYSDCSTPRASLKTFFIVPSSHLWLFLIQMVESNFRRLTLGQSHTWSSQHHTQTPSCYTFSMLFISTRHISPLGKWCTIGLINYQTDALPCSPHINL